MPSITGSEAVDKYIYIPERPPDNQILIQFVILSLIQKNHSIPLFQHASFCLKKNLINMILKYMGLSHTWYLGICVITPKVQLSERQRVLAFGVMLLADFQMPSMTVPEAVSA